MDWSEVHAEAEVLEHAVSESLIGRMDEMLGHPTVDPHGDPIPTAGGHIDEPELLDLLTLETDPHRWRDIAETVCAHVDTLTRTGDLEWAGRFTEALVLARADDAAASADDSIAHFAEEACEQLAAGAVVGHALARLREGGDDAVPHVKRLCAALGPRVVAPLAKALAADGDARVRRTARDILAVFYKLGEEGVALLIATHDADIADSAARVLSLRVRCAV